MVRNITSEAKYLKRTLEENWTFKEASKRDDFLPVSQFPTVIHLDLLHHGKIPDPTIDLSREACQWVGETKWLYRTTFNHARSRSRPNIDLVFEGLDTFATVTLNGEEILQADNTFVEYRVPVATALVDGLNILEISFDSAFLRGRELEEQQGFKNEFWNGDSSRLNVRKIACHYGWDWGPRLMTAGPFKPVYIEEYDERIEELDVDVEVLPGLDMAILSITAVTTKGSEVCVSMTGPDGEGLVSVPVLSGQRRKITIENPNLWFPVGYGKQPLYTATAGLLDPPSNQRVTQRFGIRLLEVVQQPLQPREVEGSEAPVQPKGLSFFFRVNHIPIYCQGTDWIPGDTFLPRMTRERYRHALIDDCLGSNQNMIRVWGGGQFESSRDFYDACDEYGILVWQVSMSRSFLL
jgi:beta-mannosidase